MTLIECHNCKCQFEGNFCSNCGTAAAHQSPAMHFLGEVVQPVISIASVVPFLVRPTSLASAIQTNQFSIRMAIGFYMAFGFVAELLKSSGLPVTSLNEQLSATLLGFKLVPSAVFLIVPILSCLLVLGRTYATHLIVRTAGGVAALSQSFRAALPYGAIGDLMRTNFINHNPVTDANPALRILGIALAFVLLYFMARTLSILHGISIPIIIVGLLAGSFLLTAAIMLVTLAVIW